MYQFWLNCTYPSLFWENQPPQCFERYPLWHSSCCWSRTHKKGGRFLLIGNDHRLAWILVPHWSNGKDANVTARGKFVRGCHHPWVWPTICVWQQDEGGRGGLWGPRNFLLANPFWFPLRLAQRAEREVNRLGAALARRTGQEDGKAILHRWRRLAVLLQMNNAAILTGFRVEQLTVTASCSVQACTSCD